MIVLFIRTIFRENLQLYLQNLLIYNVLCQGKYRPPSFYSYRLLLSILCVLGNDTHL